MHERDRRRVSKVTSRPAASPSKEPDFAEHKSYKIFTSKKLSFILGTLFILTGLFACVDYFGPKSVSHEKILGFPGAGNVPLIRTETSHFAIDERLIYKTPELHELKIDVEKSLITKTPLSFSLPEYSQGTKYYPLSTIYDYLWLFIACIVAGLVLFFYPKYNYTRIYIIVFSIIIFLSAVTTAIVMQVTINSIYAQHTLGW
jgi:hypothetical protein